MATKHSARIYRSRLWQCVRRAVLQRDKYRCQECGRAGRLEVHHVKRIADGGAVFAPDNLRALCRDCHFDAHRGDARPGKLSKEREEWRTYMHGATA